jgi:hypothetical protein
MLARISGFFLAALTLYAGAAWPADADAVRFTGDESARTAVFEMGGPWLLDWNVRNKTNTALPTNFEMRLHDVDSGKFVGTIAQFEGTGSGLKLFEDAGSFQIQIVAQNLIWDLQIEAVDPQEAARMKRLGEDGFSLDDMAKRKARQVAEGSFSSWRPVDDETLLLFAEDDATGYRVSFSPACPGLTEAKALSFVTAFDGGIDNYDSILLDDGTRCYFKSVVPTIFD